jgi:hypothetical protein
MTITEEKVASEKLKAIQRDITLQENNLDAINKVIADRIRQKDLLQKEIDMKSVGFNASMSEERLRLERDKTFISSERHKLEEGKKELAGHVETARAERAASEKIKEEAEAIYQKAKYLRSNVDQFIIAVQRAMSVLG